jgi:hypothetical protein
VTLSTARYAPPSRYVRTLRTLRPLHHHRTLDQCTTTEPWHDRPLAHCTTTALALWHDHRTLRPLHDHPSPGTATALALWHDHRTLRPLHDHLTLARPPHLRSGTTTALALWHDHRTCALARPPHIETIARPPEPWHDHRTCALARPPHIETIARPPNAGTTTALALWHDHGTCARSDGAVFDARSFHRPFDTPTPTASGSTTSRACTTCSRSGALHIAPFLIISSRDPAATTATHHHPT